MRAVLDLGHFAGVSMCYEKEPVPVCYSWSQFKKYWSSRRRCIIEDGGGYDSDPFSGFSFPILSISGRS